ncbi:MAG: ribosome small subunit-dependent GTPase A [Bacteroidales bacterium]|nr:ribosome small subunit-dependent GTPase A [Bacteroidales bacterium]
MEKGVVVKSTGSWYIVKKDDNVFVEAKLKGRLRIEGIKSTNPVVVGDRVILDSGNQGEWSVSDIEPRKNYLIRRATNLSKQSHIIAANVDDAFLVITFRMPETPMEFIDRFLVSSEAYRIPVCLVFNKIDLYSSKELKQIEQIEDIYRKIGYPTIKTSVTDGTGIDEFSQMLKGKVSVISGLSGVGKSSLINKVDPALSLKIGDISEYHRSGKHTTTFAEMLELKSGGYIIDTPGIRGFGLVHIRKEELYHFFPEIFKVSSACSFHNCLHVGEPGCAVIHAVDEGEISASRYNSYVNMMEDPQNKYR